MAPETVSEISRSELQDLQMLDPATIKECKHLASYNWLIDESPTITVPGSPPQWSPPAGKQTLRPDSGVVYIDQNAARSPRYPLEPLFRALFAQQPLFGIADVDLVTDRNNLRKLLRFVKGNSDEPFQIRVEIVNGKTALFMRVEKETTTRIQGFRGFGHNFEKAYTKSAPGSSGHHRIASYRFDNLQFLVRYEADGFIKSASKCKERPKDEGDTDSLSKMLETLQVADGGKSPEAGSNITIKHHGEEADDSSILEIKTRSYRNLLDMEEIMPQLWIAQTPQLAVAYHRQGVFDDIRVLDMRQKIRDWESANQQALRSLGVLLKKVIAIVKAGNNKSAIVKFDGEANLKVIIGEQAKLLPDDIYANWKGREQEEKQEVSDKALSGTEGEAGKEAPKAIGPNPTRTPVKIGGVQYELNISQFPYIAALEVQDKRETPASKAEISHDPIPLFDVAVKGIEDGYRQCFRSMSFDVNSYRTLCATYDFLGIEVCGGRTLDDIIKDLKAGQNHNEIRNRSLARDAAFRLLYYMLKDNLEIGDKDKPKIFNVVLFIVSHPGTFKRKTRKVVQAVYESRFTPTPKQRANLSRWDKSVSDMRAEFDDDVTTDEEQSFPYDSFDSDYS